MFCRNCGKELPENAKFCGGCGTPVSVPGGEETAEMDPVAPENEPIPVPQDDLAEAEQVTLIEPAETAPEEPAEVVPVTEVIQDDGQDTRILGRKKGKGLPLLIAALVLVVIVVVVVIKLIPSGGGSSAIAYVTDDGELMYRKDLKVKTSPIEVSDGEASYAVFSQDGKYLYYREDSALYRAEAAKLGKAVFDALDEAAKTIGDVELDVYVSSGCIAAVQWSDKIEGEKVELNAAFGGGRNYADDWSVEIKAGSARITVASSGAHTASGGEYTDTTSVTIRDGSDSIKITSEMSYQPKKSSDNFEWSVKSSDFSLKASGQLNTAKNSMSMELDKLSVNASGTELISFSGSCAVGPYEEPAYSSRKPTMLADMDRDDLLELGNDMAANAENWAAELYSDYPELYYLF